MSEITEGMIVGFYEESLAEIKKDTDKIARWEHDAAIKTSRHFGITYKQVAEVMMLPRDLEGRVADIEFRKQKD